MAPVKSTSQLIRAQSSISTAIIAVLCCFAAALFLYEASRIFVERSATDTIKYSISVGEFNKALYIANTNTPPSLFDTAQETSEGSEKTPLVARLLEIGAQVEKNRFSQALEIVKTTPQFSIGIRALEELSNLQKSRNLKGTILPAEVEALVLRYDAIAKDFRRTFNNVQETKGEKLAFYSEGVLKDLPTLPGIPDNMRTLEELRDAIRAADISAKIPKDAENPRQYFLSRLDRIRRYSVSLKDELSRVGVFERSAGKAADAISRNLESSKKIYSIS